MSAAELNGLIAAFSVDRPWATALEWSAWSERDGWMTAPIPTSIGAARAYEMGRLAFTSAARDYLVTEEHGRAVAIHVGPAVRS